MTPTDDKPIQIADLIVKDYKSECFPCFLKTLRGPAPRREEAGK